MYIIPHPILPNRIDIYLRAMSIFKRSYIVLKESGRIRRRFVRNVSISKKLKNYRRFIRVFEIYSFISILEYRQIGKILPKCILFLQNMILNRAMQPISYDNRQILLCFWRILLSLGLVSTNLKLCYGCVIQKWIYCIN